MSDNLPPMPPGPTGPSPGSPPPTPEYLDSASGHSFTPPAEPRAGGGMKKGLFIGGGAIGAVAVGVGAWAAVSFFSTGAQPAEALPDSTLAYASIDLDPSGGQKIEAVRTLNKFPAFKDEIGLDTDDDVVKSIIDRVLEDAPCDNLDYEDDFEPWIGSRVAVAVVTTGEDKPSPVVVLQVTDADDADESLDDIEACGGDGGGESFAWHIDGDWALLAETDEVLDDVVAATAKGTLADDEDFQTWTGEAGSAGIVTMYAAPAAGEFLASSGSGIFGSPFDSEFSCEASDPAIVEDDPFAADDDSFDSFDDGCALLGEPETELPDEAKKMLQDFKGMAGVVRFSDGALEVEFAADATLPLAQVLGGAGAGEAVGALPADTAAAYALSFGDGWVEQLLDYSAPYLGGGQDIDALVEDFEAETGLSVPEDIEALFGESAVFAVSSDIDPEALFESPDGLDVPAALKVKGQANDIERVLDTLLDQVPPDVADFLEVESDGDTVVIGPSADYRELLLKDGTLGEEKVFKDVVREADRASTVFFINLNSLEDVILEAIGDDDEVADNLKPLAGFGVTGWLDDEVGHSVMRVTTD